jgi:hypothetical protein
MGYSSDNRGFGSRSRSCKFWKLWRLNHAKVTGTIEDGYKLPNTMKLRARCEAEIESKFSLERDERGTREREIERSAVECWRSAETIKGLL